VIGVGAVKQLWFRVGLQSRELNAKGTPLAEGRVDVDSGAHVGFT
jgi:hypothetical protein